MYTCKHLKQLIRTNSKLKMQLSLTFKSCACEKCDSVKNCITPNVKSINDESKKPKGQVVRHRTFPRKRQSRPRARHSYGNQHHRLDHTYAAVEVMEMMSPPANEAPVTTKSDVKLQKINVLQEPAFQAALQPAERLVEVTGTFTLCTTWSPNARVDYQSQQCSPGKVKDDDQNKENKPPLDTIKERVQPSQKSRAMNNKIQKVSTRTIDSGEALKLINEEKKRWLAATAMLDLSREPIIF